MYLKKTKLEPSRKKGIFVGYSENSKGYRVYVPGQRSVEVSRDVIFEENIALKLSTSTKDDLITNLDDNLQLEIQRENILEVMQEHLGLPCNPTMLFFLVVIDEF